MNATRDHDEYGRPWGKPLWQGGPILGGVNWREFVAEKFGDQFRPPEHDEDGIAHTSLRD